MCRPAVMVCAGLGRAGRRVSRWREACRGQMSVEAALLLPTALVLVALLVQPACLLYTRSVMASAAAELVRVATTARCSDEELRGYALRRLASVPDVAMFHEGGPESWEVEVEGPDPVGRVLVRIEGRVRPLPLLGVLASSLGEVSGDDVIVRVEASGDVRADWVGGEYGEWIGIWG